MPRMKRTKLVETDAALMYVELGSACCRRHSRRQAGLDSAGECTN